MAPAKILTKPIPSEPPPEKPARKHRRSDGPARPQDTALATHLRDLMARRGISGRELSKRAGLAEDGVRNVLAGRTHSPRARTLQALADVLEVPLEALYGGKPMPDYVRAGLAAMVALREFGPPRSARISDGEVVGEWTIPRDAAARVDENQAYILRLPPGDLPPGLAVGDRLLADASQTIPSPPGLFVIWDGRAAFVAHLRPILGSPGRITVTIGGLATEVAEDAVDIIARVAARWTAV